MKKLFRSVKTSDFAGSTLCQPETGEHCPTSGWWAPLASESAAIFLAEGSLMPNYRGEPTAWMLTAKEVVPRPLYVPVGFSTDDGF